MTATQLIAKLQELVALYGDCNVRVTDGEVMTECALTYDEDSGDVLVDMTAEGAEIVA